MIIYIESLAIKLITTYDDRLYATRISRYIERIGSLLNQAAYQVQLRGQRGSCRVELGPKSTTGSFQESGP